MLSFGFNFQRCKNNLVQVSTLNIETIVDFQPRIKKKSSHHGSWQKALQIDSYLK